MINSKKIKNRINKTNINKKNVKIHNNIKTNTINHKNSQFCLGIESTAHTFGASIVTFDGKILSNVKKSFTTEEGGMIPSKVADHHVNEFDVVLKKALNDAKIKFSQINLIAFSNAPGLGNTLKIGQFISRFLSIRLNIPLIGVNHCIAHLEIGRLLSDLQYPGCGFQNTANRNKQNIGNSTQNIDNSKSNLDNSEQNTDNNKQQSVHNLQQSAHSPLHTVSSDPVLLYASGANTQIIAYEGKKYRIFGETLDIGIGNFLDSLARELDLGFPGGPKIEQLALNGKNFINLPYSVKGMDVNFGGLLTHVKKIINLKKDDLKNKKLNQKSFDQFKADLCYSVQEIVFSMLLEVSERALAHCDKNELLLGGGVACNKRFQSMAKIMCKNRNAKCYILENEYNVDNAAMVAWTGILQFKYVKKGSILKTNINPYERTDDVFVYWRE
jgi:tRNA A37 threonylcarbamoyltransferase TsaD